MIAFQPPPVASLRPLLKVQVWRISISAYLAMTQDTETENHLLAAFCFFGQVSQSEKTIIIFGKTYFTNLWAKIMNRYALSHNYGFQGGI